MRSVVLFLLLASVATSRPARAQAVFTSFESLLEYASTRSVTLKNQVITYTQAKRARLAAIYGILDPSGSLSASYTHNNRLPVSVFPAEIFGGQPGTFQTIRMGVPYVTTQNFYAEIKVLNLQGWEKLKLARLNLSVTETDNGAARKSLYENIATAYFNIVTLQEQLAATQQNQLTADTLYQLTLQQYQAGQVRQQQLNDAEVNKLTVEESLRQIQYQISREYLALKILCDIPEEEAVVIQQEVQTELSETTPEVQADPVALRNAAYRESYALSYRRQTWMGQLPSVSVFFSQTNQQLNTEAGIINPDGRWIPSSYVGFRISIPIPSASYLSQASKARYDYLLAQNNAVQARLTATLKSGQLRTDYEKAVSQYRSDRRIYALRKEDYQKNYQNYREGIAGPDEALKSFDALVSSQFNFLSSAIQVRLAGAKISIHNQNQ